jgi:hypothetical protein
MSTDFRALCAELAALDGHCVVDCTEEWADAMCRLRTALAQPDPISELVSQCRPLEPEMAEHLTPQARWRLYGDEPQPEPVAPTDEELLKLLSRASGLPGCDTYIVDGGRIMSEPNELLAFARAVLACYGTPANQPVLVSERLPGPENKTTDDECWFWDPISGCWFLLPGPPLNDHYTHWLPHHSLPIPRGGTH